MQLIDAFAIGEILRLNGMAGLSAVGGLYLAGCLEDYFEVLGMLWAFDPIAVVEMIYATPLASALDVFKNDRGKLMQKQARAIVATAAPKLALHFGALWDAWPHNDGKRAAKVPPAFEVALQACRSYPTLSFDDRARLALVVLDAQLEIQGSDKVRERIELVRLVSPAVRVSDFTSQLWEGMYNSTRSPEVERVEQDAAETTYLEESRKRYEAERTANKASNKKGRKS